MNICEIYQMKSGRYKWRLKSVKREPIAVSPGSFETIQEAYASINIAKGAFTHFHIIDRTQ